MEKKFALFMADLSGYTAMTETHGAQMAADLVDAYEALMRECLVGDTQLVERTGDAILIVSSAPDQAFATACVLLERSAEKDCFLQVHGGLHYGSVLQRGNRFYGSALNITARITALANPGSVWCSADFAQRLRDPTPVPLQPQGSYRLKNITEEIELMELQLKDHPSIAIDPVCRMAVQDHSAVIQHPVHTTLRFCSLHCLELFSAIHDS